MSILRSMYKQKNSIFTKVLLLGLTIILIVSGITILAPTIYSQKGGPDNYGYRWIDSNITSTPYINYNWVDGITGGTDLGLSNDQTSSFIPLGFKFPYYGKSYSSIAICSNGWASFTTSGYSATTGSPIPYSGNPNALVAPFWQDLNPGQHGNVLYKQNNQTSPMNFIITWNNVPFNIGGYKYNQTFEVVIYENGSILFQYKSINITPVIDPIIGIEDENGMNGLSYSSNFIENQSAVWFYYSYQAHDLSLKYVRMKSYSKVNKDVEIKAFVENIGYKDETNINVTLEINSVIVNWTGEIIKLNSYEGVEISFIWRPQTQGNHTVVVNILAVTGETKTDNNFLSRTIDVRNWQGIVLYDRTHGGWMEDYKIWFSDLKAKNIIIEEFTSGSITSEVLKEYNVMMIAYSYQSYSSSEQTAIHNFINAGNGLIILGRYYDNVYNPLSSPYEIVWYDHDGSSGNTNDITAHEITFGVQTVYLNWVSTKLEVSGSAKGLVYDIAKDKGLVLAISNESGPGRVACYTDPYGFDDWRINNANNRVLATQIMEWVVGDIKPPEKPKGFKAINGKVGNQVNLSWTPNTERDLNGYFLYRGNVSGVYDPNPIYIPAPASSYKDRGDHIIDGTDYYYVLAAVDEVPNISKLTAEIKVTPTDIIPPAIPFNFTVTDMGTGSSLKISWNKNKEADVVEYQLSKAESYNFADSELFKFTPEVTEYLDTEVLEGKNYYYRLSAIDEVPNKSLYTSIRVGTPYDRIAPSQPTGFNATDPGLGNTVLLTWSPGQDNDLKDYLVERKDQKNNKKLIPVSLAEHYVKDLDIYQYFDSDDLVDFQQYSYRVYARDDSKMIPPNLSIPTHWINVTPTDKTPPKIPENFTIKDESFFTETGAIHCMNLSWNTSNDIDLRGFIVYKFDFPNFKISEKKMIAILGIIDHYKDFNVEEGMEYFYKVTAFDEIPNESPPSIELKGVPKDVTPPPIPSEFKVEPLPEGGAVKISWALQPDTETEGYRLFCKTNENISEGFKLLAELDKTINEYLHTGLINDQQYYYKLQTFDAIPNYSPFTQILMTTPSDILPPNKPTGLKIDVMEAGAALMLSWKQNTDDDLAGYRVYRTSTKVYELVMAVDTETNSVIDTGLENKKTYRYYITAIDEVPNESEPSAIKIGIPEDNVAPTAPKGLTAIVPNSKDRVILNWVPSNDSDVESYHIFRSSNNKDFNELAKISFTENSYIDFEVKNGEKYYYQISASDGEPNLSPRTQSVSVEVPLKETGSVLGNTGSIILTAVIIIILFLLALFLIIRRRKQKVTEQSEADAKAEPEPSEGAKPKVTVQVVTPKQPMPIGTVTPVTTTTASLGTVTTMPMTSPTPQLPSGTTATKTTTPVPTLPPAYKITSSTTTAYAPEPEPELEEPSVTGMPEEIQSGPELTEPELTIPEQEVMPEFVDEMKRTSEPPAESKTPVKIIQAQVIEPTKPLPVILIPVDETGEVEIQGVKRDKKGHVTILNPQIMNAVRFPLRKPPIGQVVEAEKKDNK